MGAGLFYPAAERSLADLIDRLLGSKVSRAPAAAVLVPHGRYLTAGTVAGAVYARVKWPSTAVVLGAAHALEERPLTLARRGVWETPLGQMTIHRELAERILDEVPETEESVSAQKGEHSVEVQLPFLQRAGSVRRFVPVLVGRQDEEALGRIGCRLGELLREWKEPVLLVISANLSRCGPREKVEHADRMLIERILDLDEQGVFGASEADPAGSCSFHAIAAGLTAVKTLGAREGVLVGYATNADGVSDEWPVSGYAGILFR